MTDMDAPPPLCTILWSTQTGRAKACARRTARIIQSKEHVRIHSSCGAFGCAFDDASPPLLQIQSSHATPQSCWLLLFVSTTGDGEQCDGIHQTWKQLLTKSLPSTQLTPIPFAIFCLGDRAYGPQFCAAGRKLAARLKQLGAVPLCNVGYGDDGTPNGGVFADLDIWVEQVLRPAIQQRFPHLTSSPDDSPSVSLQGETMELYQVKVSNEKTSIVEPNNKNVSVTQEWQQDEYATCYNDFFKTSCPLTAYTYDTQIGNRHHNIVADCVKKSKTIPLAGRIMTNERITASDWEQETRHIRVRVDVHHVSSQSSLPYHAGDIATILPWNTPDDVNHFLAVIPESLRAIADKEIDIYALGRDLSGSTSSWPRRCTLRGLLTYCADIHSLPEREDLRALSVYCRQEHEMGKDQKERLLFLSETSGAALYADYILREKRTWADVLYDFDSISWEGSSSSSSGEPILTLEVLLSLLPPIRPRHFSIASAPSTQLVENENDDHSYFDIELCVAVVNGTTPLGRAYRGLCSTFLANQLPCDGYCPPLCLWIKPGSFTKLPLELSSDQGAFETPILCIGAGTGVAPLRSLILEREARRRLIQKETSMVDSSVIPQTDDGRDNILVFGCRKAQADFYYKDEWESLSERQQLRLLTAFSRDQWHKIYVQQVVGKTDDGMFVANHLLHRGGAIYVAGGAKMAQAVREEILECLAKSLDGGEKQANTFLKKLQRIGRYSIEAWS
mmetsp:Transcript_2971/g.4601  ORF Transcript_2971/g.4601 Transcript_2971/m.4601 type:complete len:732 (+) Transcript_2971:132-2327(+)|eukprot:CAMPEP_0195295752 /NCGR_PEP_ID=MMETSP0707-20130614/17967_1 /TAXON_ID=33640 /ORGANISM="Asterionellopsis glacialis, Strain CCMP134" /LENGTH=731 /DNA_ID=CAMNT_0040357039 /DNA_START=125 /DNA_END=2320 /DNA_ORIENTATION=+